MKLTSRASVALTGAVLAASISPVAATAAAAGPAASTPATPTAPAAWRVVSVPSSVTSPATLEDVSAASTSNAWAVGADAETAWHKGTPVILHWNGTKWAKVALSGVPGPGDLTSVSAASATDAWAVGSDKSGAVALHWNGTTWSKVSIPDSTTASVDSVAVASNGTAWLVGSLPNAGPAGTSLVEQWNGKAWHVVKTGFGTADLLSVRIATSGDVYVAGTGGAVGYYHGGSWTNVPSAAIETFQIDDVLGISHTNVWAVGLDFNNEAGIYAAVINHWNGKAWTTVNVPAHVLSQDLSISADKSGQPQWIAAEAGLEPSSTLYAYYNGLSWSSVHGATNLSGLYDADTRTAHIPGTNATWDVGGSVNDPATGNIVPVKPIIEYNP